MSSYNVLYVDDEPENLIVFSSKFKRIFNVFTAQSAGEGLEVLEKNSIQLVISDHRMPEMTGVQLLEKVRDKHPDIIRIILTAYTESEDIIDAINKGGVYYFIKKPWVGEELHALLDKSLSFYNLRERNRELIHRLYTSINELEMFYYRISHDLRGPVASQYGILSLAKSDKDPSNADQYYEMLEASIRKLDTTLNKIESAQSALDTKPPIEKIEFKELIDVIVKKLREEIDARRITLEVNITTPVEFYSREGVLYSMLENVIENSIHFSDSNKTIKTVTIDVTQSDQQVSILINDNGLGIESSQLEHIFSAFYRGHVISKGNGLGLYIVKKAVDTLGGTIEVTSTEQVGTRILITLPA